MKINTILSVATFTFSMALLPVVAHSAEIQVTVDRSVQSANCGQTDFGVTAESLKKYASRLLEAKGNSLKQENPKNGSKLLFLLQTCGYSIPGQGTFVGSFALTPVGISSGKSLISPVKEVAFGYHLYSGTFSGEKSFVESNIVKGIDESVANAINKMY